MESVIIIKIKGSGKATALNLIFKIDYILGYLNTNRTKLLLERYSFG